MSASTASFESGMKNLNLRDDPQQQIASQGQWFQASDSDEDDQPLHLNNRPASMRIKRPAHFIKPPQQPSGTAPADMRIIQSLFDSYSQKVYMEGYAEKKNDKWSRCYVELCGPVLALWDAQSEGSNEQVVPEYVQIADLNADLLGKSAESGKDNVLSLNSDGQVHLLLDFSTHQLLQQWVSAIRLSRFEHTKLQQIFTRHFLSRSAYVDILLKPTGKMEGQIEVQLGSSKESQTLWAIASDKVEEKKFFGKKSKPSKGHITLYESKKAKQPMATITNVIQAYILYPNSAQQIDSVTAFKIEASGDCKEATIKTTSSKELAQWIVSTFDAFKLYGRPDRLLDDTLNINSLNFGEPRNNGDISRLFLEVNEVSHLDVKNENLADSMAQYTNILLQKLQQQQQLVQQHLYARQSQQPMGLIHQIPSGVSMQSGQTPPQRASMYPNQAPNMANRPYIAMPQQQFGQPMPQQMYLQQQQLQQQQQLRQQQQQKSLQQTPQNAATKSHKVYASDDESEEDESEENEEDDGSDIDDISDIAKNSKATENKEAPHEATGDTEKKEQVSKTSQKLQNEVIPVTLSDEPLKQESDEESDEDDVPTVQKVNNKTPTRRSKPKTSRTQISISGSDDSDEEEEEVNYSGSDDDDIPIQQQRQQQQGQYLQEPFFDYDSNQQWDSASTYNASQNMMHPQYQGYYDENGYPMMSEDGPVIPQLGDRFATQNSLLDTYRAHHPSAHDQEDYARATGQPLIQVPNKPPAPRAGLVDANDEYDESKHDVSWSDEHAKS
ncbi:hypothetical protein BD560DRAFT_485091 [Blakeslea trispora]|nr:hypothetical protein BD560DRAFT_485091 [Blakeslea trispora]